MGSEPEFDANTENTDTSNTYTKKSPLNVAVIGMIVAIAFAAFFAGLYATSIDSDQISNQELKDTIAKLELRIFQNQLPTTAPTAAPTPTVTISTDDDPIIGDPNAPITIIEFSDFQCPFCARFYTQTLPLIQEKYIDSGKVKLIFRDYPINSIHPNAMPAAIASECANEQGKFKEMHDILFEKQREWQRSTDVRSLFSSYAAGFELQNDVFDACINSDKYVNEINNDLIAGKKYGVTGTPSFFIGNDVIGYIHVNGAQPFGNFEKIIDTQLGI